MKVVIAGAGNVGAFIARDLLATDHEVVVIEESLDVVARLSPTMSAQFVVADACEINALTHVGMETADVFVAATGDDEDNLVMSVLAKQEFAVPRTVARVNHPKNEWLFTDSWGVDVSVSTPHLMTALVEEAVSVGSLVRLLQFEGGDARLVEITLAEDSPAVGKSLAELQVPRDASLVAIVRSGHVVVPRGETVLAAGDEVLVLITGDTEESLTALLAGGG